jgi:hypothetical protein
MRVVKFIRRTIISAPVLVVCALGDRALAEPPEPTKIDFYCHPNRLDIVVLDGSRRLTVATQNAKAHDKYCSIAEKPDRFIFIFGLDGTVVPIEFRSMSAPTSKKPYTPLDAVPGDRWEGEGRGYRVTVELLPRVEFQNLGHPLKINVWRDGEHSRVDAHLKSVLGQIF